MENTFMKMIFVLEGSICIGKSYLVLSKITFSIIDKMISCIIRREVFVLERTHRGNCDRATRDYGKRVCLAKFHIIANVTKYSPW